MGGIHALRCNGWDVVWHFSHIHRLMSCVLVDAGNSDQQGSLVLSVETTGPPSVRGEATMPLSYLDVPQRDAFEGDDIRGYDGSSSTSSSCGGSSNSVLAKTASSPPHRCWVFIYAPMGDGSLLPAQYTPLSSVPLVLDAHQLSVVVAEVTAEPTNPDQALSTAAAADAVTEHFLTTVKHCKGSLVYGQGFELCAPGSGCCAVVDFDDDEGSSTDSSDVEGSDTAVLRALDAAMHPDLYERHLFLCREPTSCELVDDVDGAAVVAANCSSSSHLSASMHHHKDPISGGASTTTSGHSAGAAHGGDGTASLAASSHTLSRKASDVMQSIAECRKQFANTAASAASIVPLPANNAAYFRAWVYQVKREAKRSSLSPSDSRRPREIVVGGTRIERMSLSGASRSSSQITVRNVVPVAAGCGATSSASTSGANSMRQIPANVDDATDPLRKGEPLPCLPLLSLVYRRPNAPPIDVTRLWRTALPWVPSWYYTQDDLFAGGGGACAASSRCVAPQPAVSQRPRMVPLSVGSLPRAAAAPLPLTSDGNVWYFAFGSNMSERQCIQRLGQHRGCHPARLLHHRLVFDKPSATNASVAYANVRPIGRGSNNNECEGAMDDHNDASVFLGGGGQTVAAPSSGVSGHQVVYGVLYLLHPSQLRTMDAYEIGYQRKVLRVELLRMETSVASLEGPNAQATIDAPRDVVVDSVHAIAYVASLHRSPSSFSVIPSVTLLGSHYGGAVAVASSSSCEAAPNHSCPPPSAPLSVRLPSREYLSTILEGAPRLPHWYVQALEKQPTLPVKH